MAIYDQELPKRQAMGNICPCLRRPPPPTSLGHPPNVSNSRAQFKSLTPPSVPFKQPPRPGPFLSPRQWMEVSWNIEPPLKAPPMSLSEAPLSGKRSPSSLPFKQPPSHVPVPSLSRPPPMEEPSTIVPRLKAPPMHRRS